MRRKPSPSLFSWYGVLGLGSGFALVSFWGLVSFRILTDPVNHIGVSVLWAIPLALIALLAGARCCAARLRCLGTVLMVIGLLTVIGVVLLDRLNILVEYETWLHRGLPERPF